MDPSIKFLNTLIAVLLILWLARLLLRLRDFKAQRDYINMEIARSSAHSKKHWLKKRRRLWLRFLFLPF